MMPLAVIAPTTTRRMRSCALTVWELSHRPRISSATCDRLGAESIFWTGSTPSSGTPSRARPRPDVLDDLRDLVGLDLVQDGADDLTPSRSNSALLSAISSIGRPMPPGQIEDDLGVEELGDARVRKVEDRADAGVAGALDEREILLPGDAVEGAADLVDDHRMGLRRGSSETGG